MNLPTPSGAGHHDSTGVVPTVTYAPSSSISSATGDRLVHVVEYIHNHLAEKLTIADLSRRACLSEGHFGKVFRKEIGMTPVAFIKEKRLMLAASLLAEPRGGSVRRVWVRCGFNGPSYFGRCFRARFGLTPTGYRARVLGSG